MKFLSHDISRQYHTKLTPQMRHFPESQNQLPNGDGRAAAGAMWGSHNINLEANIHSFREFYMDRVILSVH